MTAKVISLCEYRRANGVDTQAEVDRLLHLFNRALDTLSIPMTADRRFDLLKRMAMLAKDDLASGRARRSPRQLAHAAMGMY